jgi:hypothetical protein
LGVSLTMVRCATSYYGLDFHLVLSGMVESGLFQTNSMVGSDQAKIGLRRFGLGLSGVNTAK